MNNYMSYQNMLAEVQTNLVTIRKACDRLGLEEQGSSLREMQERLQNHVFRVGIMGEFKRGKSTVINALLGKEVVPADILPCSATLNRIVWDASPHATVNFKEETGQPPIDVSVDELATYVTKLTADSEKTAEYVEDAVVYYPCEFCKNGVEIVDTPGLNDDERMNRVSESVIPTLDAIILVLVPGAPFSMSEAAFVRNKLMTSDLSRLVFVVNKIDQIRPKDRARSVEGIRQKINETILQKSADMYGADSQEYRDVSNKLAGIRIFPISAADALDAKLDCDDELLATSGMVEFEKALSVLLTEERGMLELVGPVSSILSKCKEIDNVIQIRTNAMAMDKEEFDRVQQEAADRLEAQRAEMKVKVKEVKAAAACAYRDLLPAVSTAYDDLESRLVSYVESYPISVANFNDESGQSYSETRAKEFSDTFSVKVNGIMTSVLQESTEKIQVEISKRMQTEIASIEAFGEQLTLELNDIAHLIPKISSQGAKKSVNYIATGLEIATNFTNIIPGLGAAITGFRDHGVLGGVVGLGAGYATTLASVAGSSYLLAAIGLTGGAVLVPALVVGGIVGALGGRKITDSVFKFFGKEKRSAASQSPRAFKDSDIPGVRKKILSSVQESVQSMRDDQMLENWLKTTTDEAFGELSDRLESETELALQSMQDTLTQIQIDLASEDAQREASMRSLKATQDELISVMKSIKPVKDKLDASMSRAM